MVATIGGAGLGVFNTSAQTLGLLGVNGNAAQGKRGERVYVNSATGNLVIQATDEQLASSGLDLSLVRTYNSQGLLDGDNNDNWRMGVYQSISVSGTPGATTATVTKTFGDGATAIYRWDASKSAYVSSDGDGAHDSFSYVGGQWLWTDGSSRVVEAYDASGRIVSSKNTDGVTDNKATTYSYNASGRLYMVVDPSGQTTYLDYASNGTSANLSAIRVVSNGQTQTLTRYTYDASNRLQTVTLDLTPENSADARNYVTTYTYFGSTKQVETITQSDGSAVRFEYHAGSARVRLVRVTAASGVTRDTLYAYSGAYNAVTGTYAQCDVTDALNRITTYKFDGSGRLTSVSSPTVGGERLEATYGYDTSGNLTSYSDGEFRSTTYTPDANGNIVSTRDALGNTITRTYGTTNQVLTETHYPAGGTTATGALVTRFVYDGEQHLRFRISADGRVTEYRYHTAGQVATEISYTGTLYAAGTTAPNETTMAAWVASVAVDKTKTQRVDYAYDFRGQISSASAWAGTDASGAGTPGTASVTRYVYDQRGYLLQTIEPRGETTTDTTDYITSSTYDGLGRTTSTTQWLAAGQTRQTLYTYTDSAGANTLATRFANGLTTTSTYNLAGELTSMVNTGSTSGALGTTSYTYDALGELRTITDPTGIRQYLLYDEAGRKKADVDADGTLTEYFYDSSDVLVETMRYAVKVSATLLNTLSDAQGNPPTATTQTALLNALRAAADANRAANQITRDVYDTAGRLVFSIDEAGGVTGMLYDGAGRLTDTIAYAAQVNINRDLEVLTPAQVTVVANADDRRTRYYYNGDGQLVGQLDGEGYLSENFYDAAGRLVQTTAYAGVASAAQRASTTLLSPRPALDNLSANPPEKGANTYLFYDGQGRLVGQLDAEGYFSETVYDVAGRATQATRYNVQLAYTAGATTFQTLKTAAATAARHTDLFNDYDGAGRLRRATNFEGTVTTYEYDNADNLVRSTLALGVAADERTTQVQFDELGRVKRTLSAEGSVELIAAVGATAIEAVWARYGTSFNYDAAGRLVSQTQTAFDKGTGVGTPIKTVFYYDADGRTRFIVDSLGNVIETQYNALGQTTATLTYTNRIDPTGLNGGLLTDTLTRTPTTGTAPGRLTPAVDAVRDGRITYTYTLTGQVQSRVTAIGAGATYEYNAFDEKKAQIERIGQLAENRTRRSEFSYDHRGLLKTTLVDTAGLRAGESYAYDAFGNQKSFTDALTHTRLMEFDRLGRTIAVTDGAGGKSATRYDAYGRVLQQLDGQGSRQITAGMTQAQIDVVWAQWSARHDYNDATQTSTLTTAEGVVISQVHNRHGQELSVTAAGGTTTYSYDRNGQLSGASDVIGTLETRVYDSTGRQVTGTDSRGTVTRFAYDAGSLLLTRTVDTGGLALQTGYVYDGQGRVLQITEPGGRITRNEYDADGRVKSIVVDPVTTANPAGLNIRTEFTYDLESNTVTIIEGVGTVWQRTTLYAYDSLGRRISQTEDQGTGRLNLVTQYRYDLANNVRRSIDSNNNATWYFYDGEDRLILSVDAQGGVIGITYDADGRKQTERSYTNKLDVSAWGDTPAQPSLTINATDVVQQTVYDKDGRIAYVISGIGGVTEFSYTGPVMRSRIYATRVASGFFTSVTAIQSALTAAGNSLTTVGAQDVVSWVVSDERGRDAFAIDGTGGVLQFTYDGNDNLVQSTAFAVRRATGLAVDRASLRSFATANAGNAGNLVSKQAYDRADRLVMSVTAGATATSAVVRSFTFYDAMGRVVGSIDGDGSLTEYLYDARDHVVKETHYAVFVPGATLASLVDASGNPTNVSLATLKTAMGRAAGATAADRVTRSVYDNAGRLIYSVSETGAVAKRDYDTAGRLVTATMYANLVTIAPDRGALLPTDVVVTANAARDRVLRYFFDNEGNQTGLLEAEGYLIETTYDSLGQVTSRVGYANATTASLRAAGTLAQLRPTADTGATDGDTERDARSYFFYDGLGRQVGSLDADGYFSETVYDNASHISQSIRYDRVLGYTAGTTTFQTLKTAAAGAATQVMSYLYDGAGRAYQQTDYAGTLSTSSFDNAGRTVSVTAASGTTEARTTQTRYDAQGRVSQTLSGEGTKALAVAGADVETVWNRYGTRYTYDAGGRLATETAQAYDAVNGTQTLTTVHYYDADGRERFTINGLGEVAQKTYDVFGQLTESNSYANRIASPGAGGLLAANQAGTLTPIATVTTATTTASDAKVSYTYTLAGQVDTVLTAMGASTVHHYDTFGLEWERLEKIDATRTRRTEFSYDKRGLLLDNWSDTTGLGVHERKTYDAFGRVRTITDARGNLTRIDHDTDTNAGSATLGRATVVTTDALNGKRITSYDAFNRVMRVLDPVGASLITAGMTAAQVEAVWTQYSTKYSYVDASRSVTVTTPQGIQATTVGNRHGQTLSITAAGNTTTYTYNANGDLSGVSDLQGASVAERTLESRAYDSAGRLVTTTDGKGDVTRLAYDAASRVLTSTVGHGSPNPLATSYQFDGQGRVTLVTEPTGRITRTDYDRDGRITLVSVDPSGVNLRTFYTYDLEDRALTVTESYLTASAVTTEYRFDTLGRRTDTYLDPAGLNLRTQYKYDANGNLTRMIDAAGYDVWYVYDAKNRGVFTVNELGQVSQTLYDAQDRVVSTRRYFNPLNTTSLGDQVLLSTMTNAVVAETRDRLDQTIYDRDGRASYSIDAMGGVTENRFDAAGHVIRSRVFSYGVSPVPVGTYSETSLRQALTIAGNLGVDPAGPVQYGPKDLLSWAAYDQRGQLAYAQDGTGGVTGYAYDNAGNLVTETIYAAARSITAGTTLADFRGSLNAADAANRVTRHWYDAADRARFTLDGEGNLFETRYTHSARETREIIYATARTGLTAASTLANVVTAAGALDATRDRVTITVADKVGRVASVTDGAGAPTTYSYDLETNQRRIRDAKGGETLETYDKAGRLLSRRSPGNVLLTNTVFDGLGNVLSATQSWVAGSAQATAAGGVDARTTTYVYDRLGRVTQVTDGEDFTTRIDYTVFGKQSRITTGLYLVPTTATNYSAAKATRAAKPMDSQFVYNANDQVSDFTDGENNVTHHSYDAAGRRIVTIEAYTGANAAAARTTTYEYDTAGRLTKVINPLNGITKYTYTTGGEKKTEQVLQSATVDTTATGASTGRILLASGEPSSNAVWSTTTYEYYRNGRLKAQIIPYGAGATASTTRNETSYDAAGNVTELRFAAGTTDERRVQMRYDLANRKSAELDGEAVAALTASNVEQIWSTRATQYRYDGLGNLAKVTLPANIWGRVATTRYYYNADSQLTTVLDGEGFVNTFGYDAAGNQTRASVYVTALSATTFAGISDASGEPAPVATAGQDRVTLQHFDRANRLDVLTAPDGVRVEYTNDSNGKKLMEKRFYAGITLPRVMTYSYDRNGRLLQFMDVDGLYGAANNTYINGTVTIYTYDGAGNQTSMNVIGTLTVNDRNTQRLTRYEYDLNNRRIKETFDPTDAATTRVELNLVRNTGYDAAGNVVLQTNNALTTTGAPTEVFAYDLNNQLIRDDKLANSPMLTFGGPLMTSIYGYDRVGNRTSVTNGRNAVTTYVYDKSNRLTQELLPQILYYQFNLDTHTEQPGRPTTTHRYDWTGQEYQTTDANGNRTTLWRDRNGRVATQLSALGGLSTYKYNGAGEAIEQIEYENPVAASVHDTPATQPGVPGGLTRTTLFAYDRAGRLTQKTLPAVQVTAVTVTMESSDTATNPVASRSSIALTERHVYNAFGDEVETYDRAGNRTLRYYDVRHREVMTIDEAGNPQDTATLSPAAYAVTRQYDTVGNVVSQSVFTTPISKATLATFTTAAPPPVATLGAADTTIWAYDGASRMTMQTDPAVDIDVLVDGVYTKKTDKRITLYTYDESGNQRAKIIASESGTAGISLTEFYYYDGAGRRVAMIDKNRVITYYSYDAAGNLTRQWKVAGQVSTSATLTQGNLPTYVFDLMSSLDPVFDQVTDYTYDAANRLKTETDRMLFSPLVQNGAIIDNLPADDLKKETNYDLAGNRSRTIDEQGYATRVEYNAAGQVKQTISADLVGSVFEYDVFGNLVTLYTGIAPYGVSTDGYPVAAASPATITGAQMLNGAVNVSYTAALGNTTSWIVYDTVSRSDIRDYTLQPTGARAVTTGEMRVELPNSAGRTVFFRVVTSDDAGNLAWSSERSVSTPANLINTYIGDTGRGFWSTDIRAAFDGAVSNVKLLSGPNETTLSHSADMTLMPEGNNLYTAAYDIGQPNENWNLFYAVQWTDASGAVHTSQTRTTRASSDQIDLNTTTTQSALTVGGTSGYRLQASVKVPAAIYSQSPDIGVSFTQMQASWKLAGSTAAPSTTAFVNITTDNSYIYSTPPTRLAGTYTFLMSMGDSAPLAAGTYRVEIAGKTNDGRTIVIDSYDVVVGAGQPASKTQQTSSWIADANTPGEGYGTLYKWTYPVTDPNWNYREVEQRFPVMVASDGRRVVHVRPQTEEGDNYKTVYSFGHTSAYAPATVKITSSTPTAATTTLTITLTLSPQEAATVDNTGWNADSPSSVWFYARRLTADGYAEDYTPTNDAYWGDYLTRTSPNVYTLTLTGVPVGGLFQYQIQYNVDPLHSDDPSVYNAVGHLFSDNLNIGVATTTNSMQTFIETQQIAWGTIWYSPFTHNLDEGYQGHTQFGPDGSTSTPRPDGALTLGTSAGQTSGQRAATGQTADYTIRMQYDALNQKIASNENNGLYTEYGYDKNGNVVETRVYGVQGNSKVITSYAVYDKRDRKIMDFGALTPVYQPGGTPINERRVTRQKYDAYNHVVSQWTQVTRGTDTKYLGARTDYTYNALGARTSKTDITRATPNGLASDVTRYRYNLLGLQTRMYLPNGNAADRASATFYYDQWARLTTEVDALGYQTGYTYDLYDRLKTKTDARGMLTGPSTNLGIFDYTTFYDYDNRDRLITQWGAQIWSLWYSDDRIYQDERVAILGTSDKRLASSLTDADRSLDGALARQYRISYGYDKRNNRNVVQTAPGTKAQDTVTTTYDAMGRVWKTVRTGNVLNGVTQTIDSSERAYDAYGNLIREIDGMARIRSYEYGTFGRRSRLTDEDGIVINYKHDVFGRLESESGVQQPTPPGQAQVFPKAINYYYNDDGTLSLVQDFATSVYSSYEYDVRGNRRHELVTLNPLLTGVTATLRNVIADYYADDKLAGWTDRGNEPNYSMFERITYDANGNVIQVTGKGQKATGQLSDETLTIDHVYTYDNADHVKTETLRDREGIEGSDSSVAWGYDPAGNLMSINEVKYTDVNGQSGVDAMNRLRLMSSNSTLRGMWRYDPLGREVYSWNEVSRYVTDQTTTTYLGTGANAMESTVVVERRDQLADNTDDRTKFIWQSTNASVYDKSARVLTRKSTGAHNAPTINYTFSYFEDGREKKVSATGGANPVATDARYDANNNLVFLDQDRSADLSHHHERSWNIYDNDGHIIFRTHDEGLYALNETAISSLGGLYTQDSVDRTTYLYVNGNPVGEAGYKPLSGGAYSTLDSGNYSLVRTAGSANTSTYKVVAGDTLTSIASQVYGNPSLWYVIADANGLTGSEPLNAGMNLTIPSSVQVGRVNADNHAVYDQNRILGSTLPNVLGPPAPKPSVWIQTLAGLVAAIIAIVITIVTVGIGSAAGVVAGSAAALGIAALGGALGGLASAGILIGASYLQSRYMGVDWDMSAADIRRSLIGGAITGALSGIGTQWLGAGFGAKGVFAGAWSGWVPVAKAAIAVTNNALNQWSAKDFDNKGSVVNWAGVAGAGLASGASSFAGMTANAASGALVGAGGSLLGQVATYAGGKHKDGDSLWDNISWTGVAVAGIGGLLSSMKNAKQEQLAAERAKTSFVVNPDKINSLSDLENPANQFTYASGNSHVIESFGDTIDTLSTLQTVLPFVTPAARLVETGVRNGGLQPTDWIKAVGDTITEGVKLGFNEFLGNIRADVSRQAAAAAQAKPAAAMQPAPLIRGLSFNTTMQLDMLFSGGSSKGRDLINQREPYKSGDLFADAGVPPLQLQGPYSDGGDGRFNMVEEALDASVSPFRMDVPLNSDTAPPPPVVVPPALVKPKAEAPRPKVKPDSPAEDHSTMLRSIDSALEAGADFVHEVDATVRRAAGEVSGRVTVNEKELNDLFSQPAFGSTPIQVRVEPQQAIQNTDLTLIGDYSEFSQLESLAGPAPKISAYFVGGIRTEDEDYVSVVSNRQGLGRVGGHVVALDSNAAIFGSNTNQIAHEIGHNMGLDHEEGDDKRYNLMHTSGQREFMGQVTYAQAQKMLSSPLVQTDPVTGGRFIQVAPIAVQAAADTRAPANFNGATRRFTNNYMTPWARPLMNAGRWYGETAMNGNLRATLPIVGSVPVPDPVGPLMIKYFGGKNRWEAKEALYKDDVARNNMMDFMGRALQQTTGAPMEANRQFVGSLVFGLMAYGKLLDIQRTGKAITGETTPEQVMNSYWRDNIKYGITNYASYKAGHFLPGAGAVDPATGMPRSMGRLKGTTVKWLTEFTFNQSMKVLTEQLVKAQNAVAAQSNKHFGTRFNPEKPFGFFGETPDDALRALLTGHEGLITGYFMTEGLLIQNQFRREFAEAMGTRMGLGVVQKGEEWFLRTFGWGSSRHWSRDGGEYLKDHPVFARLQAMEWATTGAGAGLSLVPDVAMPTIQIPNRLPPYAQTDFSTYSGQAPASSMFAREGLRTDLAAQAQMPSGLRNAWSSLPEQLPRAFQVQGATVTRQPYKAGTSGLAQAYTVSGHPLVKNVQYHPGGGVHGGQYFKFGLKNGAEYRVIDPASGFKPGTIAPNQRYFNQYGTELKYRSGTWSALEGTASSAAAAGSGGMFTNWDFSKGSPRAYAIAGGVGAAARYVGGVGMAVGALTDGLSLYHQAEISIKTGDYSNSDYETRRVTGGWIGSGVLGGAGVASGAAVGSFFGPVGTVIGGIIGGLAGGGVGYRWGSTTVPSMQAVGRVPGA